jgi:hypothetical protein
MRAAIPKTVCPSIFIPPMKHALKLSTLASIFLLSALAEAQQFKTNVPLREDKGVAPPEEPYHASRGLITLQGPSGMFINPTSATLPQGKFTLQYCLFFPNRDTDIVGHGTLISYGVLDWLEVGFVGNLIDVNDDLIPDQRAINRAALAGQPISADKAGRDKEFVVGGPMLRARLLRDQQWWPEISVGGYVKWGTNALNAGTIFVAASKRIHIDPDGFFKSLTIQTGARQTWFDKPQGRGVRDSGRFYGGLELELPYRLYLIGELTQKDNDFDRRMPFAYGIQCRLPGINLTFAALQDGGPHERVGLYSGVGISFGF